MIEIQVVCDSGENPSRRRAVRFANTVEGHAHGPLHRAPIQAVDTPARGRQAEDCAALVPRVRDSQHE
jgi:hypothetical protein